MSLREKWLARSREIGTTGHRHWIEQILLAISRGPPLLSARPTLAKCSNPAGVPGSRPHDTRKLIAEKEQFSRLPTSYSSSRAALFSQEGGSVGEVSQGAAHHPATNLLRPDPTPTAVTPSAPRMEGVVNRQTEIINWQHIAPNPKSRSWPPA